MNPILINNPYKLINEIENHCDKHNISYVSKHFQRPNNTILISSCPKCLEEEERNKFIQLLKNDAITNNMNRIKKMFKRSAIPPRYAHDDFDTYETTHIDQKIVKNKLITFAKEFKEYFSYGKCAILAGNSGTGKGHLAISVAKEIMKQGYTAFFITVGEMLDNIQSAGWDKGKEISKYFEPDLLILDEVAHGMNSKEQEYFFRVLHKRYEWFKPTIIISNLSLEELKTFIGGRILDRIRENKGPLVVCFNWDSYRPKILKKEDGINNHL